MLWLWGMLIFSMVLVQTLWVLILLSTIGILVTFHICYMSKSRKKDKNL